MQFPYLHFDPRQAGAALLALGCALGGGSAAADGIVALKAIGEAIVDSGTEFAETEIGGLSGIDYDPTTGVYYAISDDPAATGPVRFYSLTIDLGDGELAAGDVTFTGVTEILDRDGESFSAPIDPEALRYEAGSATLYWANEGSDIDGSLQAPWVRQMDAEGNFLREMVNDDQGEDKYAPTGSEGTTGIRNNKSFESLTFSRDGRHIYTATEEALKQDGSNATLTDATPTRILAYEIARGTPVAEYVLVADPVVEPSDPPGQFTTAGLVELLAYSDTEFLALERSFSVGGFGNGHTAKLYSIDIADATNVIGFESLEGETWQPARKRLLLDLKDLGITLDNLEGMTFGPMLPDGRRSLILVSDNNFNASTQFTQFLAFAVETGELPVRFASFNGSFDRTAAGELVETLQDPEDPRYQQQQNVAEIIQRVRPDVLWFNEFDWDEERAGPALFQQNFLGVGQNGEVPIVYPYVYQGPFYTDEQGAPESPSNTGIQSGIDLNNDGRIDGNDAYGFGFYPGQFASVLFSMYPIDVDNIRTFRDFLWQDMPGNLIIDDLPSEEQVGTIFNDAAIPLLRLSSKNHMDIPIKIDGEVVHVLGAHPTPPVFDSPTLDENGRRNHDEIRIWSDYVSGLADYLYDDNGNTGGLAEDDKFVIMGDYNADPNDGDSFDQAMLQLLDNRFINTADAPTSDGGSAAADDQGLANDRHTGDPAFDTADFNDATEELCAIVPVGCFTGPGNLRADYALPSRTLDIVDSGVYWPPVGTPDAERLMGEDKWTELEPGIWERTNNVKDISSDHRLVYVDLMMFDGDVPATGLTIQEAYLAYYGRSGDPAGLAFWEAELEANGGDLRALIDSFSNAREFRLLYGDLDNRAFIATIYRQLFDREPDAAGEAFYLEQLATGALSRATLPLDILLGARGSDLLVLQNKIEVADYFTEQVVDNELPYNDDNVEQNRSILEGVGLDPASVDVGRDGVDVFVVLNNGEPVNFERIATFPVYFNLAAGEDPASETSAEIIVATPDGNTLVYTDSPLKRLGLVDITNPEAPMPLGFFAFDGEPTSVAMAGNYALAGVNTSASFVEPSGYLAVIDLSDVAAPALVTQIDLGGQPDSVAVSPDGRYTAIAIENERDEDACAAGDGSLIDEAFGDEDLCETLGGDFGGVPQLPAGFLVVVELAGEPSSWVAEAVDLTGLAAVAPIDPEPEFVDINYANQVAVTLQENNHLVVVDAATRSVSYDLNAGTVDLFDVDAVENGVIDPIYDLLDLRREPDAIAWAFDDLLFTANEGDLVGGSRGGSLFDDTGVLYDTGEAIEYAAIAVAHFPEDRAENKGAEPEGAEFGIYGDQSYLFLGAERGNFVAVFTGSSPEDLSTVQLLPTGVGPEGLHAIPGRGLFVVAAESDEAGDGFRSIISIYRLANVEPFYPQIESIGTPPIGWGALSGLAAGIADPDTLYTVHDSAYEGSRIFTLDVSQTPAKIVDETVITKDGEPVDYDLEGIAQRAVGGFWVVSEGRADGAPNLLIKVGAGGIVLEEIELPQGISITRTNSGFEGVAVTGSEDNESVLVAVQREWRTDPDGFVKIARYSRGFWDYFYYPLDPVPPVDGAWVGLSEIVSLGDGDAFAVIERDNQQGPLASLKRIYQVRLSDISDQGLVYPVFEKVLLRDLMPDLAETNGWIPDKVEGLAIAADDQVYVVSDNDGIDDALGETYFLRLGTTDEAFLAP